MIDTIRITCDDSAHEGEVLTLYTFKRGELAPITEVFAQFASNARAALAGKPVQPKRAPTEGWYEETMTAPRGSSDGSNTGKSHRYVAEVQLVGNRVDEAGLDDPQPDPETIRLRYRFKCRPCGDALPVRHENLVPIFDRLADAGIGSITLSALRARVSK